MYNIHIRSKNPLYRIIAILVLLCLFFMYFFDYTNSFVSFLIRMLRWI